MSFDFRETAIKSVAGDLDGHAIYVGNGSGDLASFDIRTGLELHEHLISCLSCFKFFLLFGCIFSP
mgnify:CR=1 FL=1